MDAATRHFEDALAMNARIGRPFVARTQYEWAALLLERGRAADRRRAATLLDEAVACAGEIGMAEVLRRAAELRARTALRPPGRSRRPARA
jgi:hypothetical protein